MKLMEPPKLSSLRNSSNTQSPIPQQDHHQSVDKSLARDHDYAPMSLKSVSRFRPVKKRKHFVQDQRSYRSVCESGKLDRVLRDEKLEQQKYQRESAEEKQNLWRHLTEYFCR